MSSTTINEKDLSTYCTANKALFEKVREDIWFCLDKHVSDYGSAEVKRAFSTSTTSFRIKSTDSVLRKVRRDQISSMSDLPGAIEDFIGMRIVTLNKVDARLLFEHFQSCQKDWFVPIEGDVKCVPYTQQDGNKHSMRTGYQAFHITFQHDHQFKFCSIQAWPCEIQIMSQLWAFWAEYSRQYFYGSADESTKQLLPYNNVISKLLDSADDLMVETAKLLRADADEAEDEPDSSQPAVPPEDVPANTEHQTKNPEKSTPIIVTADQVSAWLSEHIGKELDSRARIPNSFFLGRIAEELTLYQVSLERLASIVGDLKLRSRYKRILDCNHISYLPIYQQLLCYIMLSTGADMKSVVERANSQLWLQGIRLDAPSEE